MSADMGTGRLIATGNIVTTEWLVPWTWTFRAVAIIAVQLALCTVGSAHPSTSHWNVVAGKALHASGVTRTYYVGADQLVWDYAPAGINVISNTVFDGTASLYVKNGAGRIGSRYIKCIYRPYSDSSFARVIPRPRAEEYLGLLGPVLRAEVGDTIKVIFRNACSIPASMHPHGVFYTKANEGAPYNDATGASEKTDDAVLPGNRHTYTCQVPERAGPASHDGSSVMWMYHSHVDEVADVYAGLTGPMVITAQGKARLDGSPKDVDREAFVLFTVIDENKSPYLSVNVQRFGSEPQARS